MRQLDLTSQIDHTMKNARFDPQTGELLPDEEIEISKIIDSLGARIHSLEYEHQRLLTFLQKYKHHKITY